MKTSLSGLRSNFRDAAPVFRLIALGAGVISRQRCFAHLSAKMKIGLRLVVVVVVVVSALAVAASASEPADESSAMYRTDLSEAKARAKDFIYLQNRQTHDVKAEEKAILQYKQKELNAEREKEKSREQFIAERNRHPVERHEDEMEQKWLAAQEIQEKAEDKLRAKYIRSRHHIDMAIEEQAHINPNAEYDLRAPATEPITEYLKNHPVEFKKPQAKLAPDGELLSPGATLESPSSPPAVFGRGSGADGFSPPSFPAPPGGSDSPPPPVGF